MLAVLFAAALVAAPQGDETARNVVIDVCLPFVGGDADMTAAEFLGFVPAGETEDGKDYASSDARQAYLLRLTSDDGEESGEVRRTCVLQARSAALDAVKAAVRRPLEAAGFVAEAGQPANRPIWTRQGVSVSIRQNEGRATVVRVNYSSLDAAGS